MPHTVKCPTCQQPVVWLPENQFRPFCSHRCQLIDLGEWVTDQYRIDESNPEIIPSQTDTEK